MPVDPAVQALLDLVPADAPPLSSLEPDVVRAGLAALGEQQGTPEEVASVEDRSVPGPARDIPVRIYKVSGDAGQPALVYFHGGGWVVCDLDTHDNVCRALANAANCTLVSVDYRLAPEHKYPAASDDCYAATQWVAGNAADLGIDPARIAVGGDSAGGHLTAVITQMARDQGGPALIAQVLHCPVTNLDYSTSSYRDNAEGYGLGLDTMEWFWNHYVSDTSQASEIGVSPLRGDLANLPAALVQTAEFDPLRDEGAQYAEKLQAAGVSVTYTNYDGLNHDTFLSFGLVPKGRDNLDEAASFLRAAFGS
jgi:acetyl esterase